MAKKEVKTDLWVYELLKEVNIDLEPHGSSIKEINEVLKSASKSGTGNEGFPEYVGDGKSSLINENFLNQDPKKLQLKESTVGMMNPPYSQGSKQNPDLYELSFTELLLDSLVEEGRAVVIIPQSSMTGKTKEEQSIKENILKNIHLKELLLLIKTPFMVLGLCLALHCLQQVSHILKIK